jgi:hypothetical protein
MNSRRSALFALGQFQCLKDSQKSVLREITDVSDVAVLQSFPVCPIVLVILRYGANCTRKTAA